MSILWDPFFSYFGLLYFMQLRPRTSVGAGRFQGEIIWLKLTPLHTHWKLYMDGITFIDLIY